ncbi:hypothetical protein LJR235_004802 [Pararhizobium sp. LjRoot235]|uniref:hypothetical protein n=1 Tax=Pararhizobium sp. LjRoot235 TaxID=3342291 RepID=UPI003ED056A9
MNDLACFRFIDSVSLAVIGDLIGRLCVPLGLSVIDVMGHGFLPFFAKRRRGTDVPGDKEKSRTETAGIYLHQGMQRLPTLLSRPKMQQQSGPVP